VFLVVVFLWKYLIFHDVSVSCAADQCFHRNSIIPDRKSLKSEMLYKKNDDVTHFIIEIIKTKLTKI